MKSLTGCLDKIFFVWFIKSNPLILLKKLERGWEETELMYRPGVCWYGLDWDWFSYCLWELSLPLRR